MLLSVIVVIITAATIVTGAPEQNEAIAKPECMQHEFSQKAKMFGNLERKAGNKGKLSFKVDPSEVLHIFFRIHPRKYVYYLFYVCAIYQHWSQSHL